MNHQAAREAARHFRSFRDEGDSAALTVVFDAVAPELMALAAHLARDLAEAEDLVQECFLVAIRKARRWDPRRPLMPWLAGILVREARKQRRRHARSADVARLRTRTTEDGPRRALQGELRGAVEGALARLPATYAEVLRAHLIEGDQTPEIAARLDRAPGTVRVQLHRGLELLRRALPAGLAPGLLIVLAPRGLGAVRQAVAAEALLRGPALAAAGAGAGLASTLSLPLAGALAMNAKTLALASTLVAALLGVAWVVRDAALPDAGTVAATRAPALSPEATDAPVPAASLAQPQVADEGAAREAVLDTPDEPVERVAPTPLAKGARLRGRFVANGPVGPEGFAMRVRVDSERELRLVLPGAGPFDVDLTELIAPAAPDALSVNVEISAAGFKAGRNYAQLVEEETTTTTAVYEIELELLAIVRSLSGRVVDRDERPVSGAWVVFLNEHGGVDPRMRGSAIAVAFAHLPEVRTGADGTFELELAEGGPAALLFGDPGHAIGQVELAPEALGALDLGDLTLPDGARVAGRAENAGEPLAPGSVVRARLAFVPSPFTLNQHDVQLVGERPAWREVSAVVGERGEFALVGLEPELEYHLVAEPERGAGGFGPLVGLEAAGTAVTAPAEGVVLDWGLLPVTLVVRAAGRPVPEPRVRPIPAPADPRAGLPRMLQLKWGLPATGDERGVCALLLPRDAVTRLSVEAAGFETRLVEVDPDRLPPSGEVQVELSGGPEPATLVVSLTGAAADGLEGAYAFLLRIDFEQGFDRLGPAPVRERLARFEQVPVGTERINLSWHVPQTVSFDELPFVLGDSASMEFSPLLAGEVRTVELQTTVGGRIELHLLGRDPRLTPPAFELEDAKGELIHPTPIVRDPRGHDTRRSVEEDGPILLGRALAPGRYVLRQTGADYAAGARDVLVRAGEVTPLSFQLEPE